MYRLEKLNEKGEIEKTKEYKTIKECAEAFNMPYHIIQRLVYHGSGELVYKKAVTDRTKNLIKNYRIIKVNKDLDIDVDMSDDDVKVEIEKPVKIKKVTKSKN